MVICPLEFTPLPRLELRMCVRRSTQLERLGVHRSFRCKREEEEVKCMSWFLQKSPSVQASLVGYGRSATALAHFSPTWVPGLEKDLSVQTLYKSCLA